MPVILTMIYTFIFFSFCSLGVERQNPTDYFNFKVREGCFGRAQHQACGQLEQTSRVYIVSLKTVSAFRIQASMIEGKLSQADDACRSVSGTSKVDCCVCTHCTVGVFKICQTDGLIFCQTSYCLHVFFGIILKVGSIQIPTCMKF